MYTKPLGTSQQKEGLAPKLEGRWWEGQAEGDGPFSSIILTAPNLTPNKSFLSDTAESGQLHTDPGMGQLRSPGAAAFLEIEFLSFYAKEINLIPGLPTGSRRAVQNTTTALFSSRP